MPVLHIINQIKINSVMEEKNITFCTATIHIISRMYYFGMLKNRESSEESLSYIEKQSSKNYPLIALNTYIWTF